MLNDLLLYLLMAVIGAVLRHYDLIPGLGGSGPPKPPDSLLGVLVELIRAKHGPQTPAPLPDATRAEVLGLLRELLRSDTPKT